MKNLGRGCALVVVSGVLIAGALIAWAFYSLSTPQVDLTKPWRGPFAHVLSGQKVCAWAPSATPTYWIEGPERAMTMCTPGTRCFERCSEAFGAVHRQVSVRAGYWGLGVGHGSAFATMHGAVAFTAPSRTLEAFRVRDGVIAIAQDESHWLSAVDLLDESRGVVNRRFGGPVVELVTRAGAAPPPPEPTLGSVLHVRDGRVLVAREQSLHILAVDQGRLSEAEAGPVPLTSSFAGACLDAAGRVLAIERDSRDSNRMGTLWKCDTLRCVPIPVSGFRGWGARCASDAFVVRSVSDAGWTFCSLAFEGWQARCSERIEVHGPVSDFFEFANSAHHWHPIDSTRVLVAVDGVPWVVPLR